MPERQVITALTGTAAPLLTVDVSIVEELDYASLFLPRPWKKSAPFVMDVFKLDPLGQYGLTSLSNQEINFELPKCASLVDDVILEVNLPAHTITPLGSSVSYTDWLGLAIWRRMEFRYSAQNVFVIEPQDEYLRIRKTLGTERLDSMRTRCYGDQTTAQRQVLFTNGTGKNPILAPLYFPFGDDWNMSLPIVDLSQKTRYSLHLRNLNDVIYNPTAATVVNQGPYEFRLIFSIIHTTGDETAMFIALAEEPTGIDYMIHQHIRQEFQRAVLPGLAGQKIHQELNQVNRPLVYLNWCMIPTNLINNSGTNDFFFFNPNPPLPIPPGMNPYTPILAWKIEASGQIIQREVRRTYTTLYNYDRYNKGFSGEDSFDQMYSIYPHCPNAACGFIDYANLGNARLEIELDVGGTGFSVSNPAMPQNVTVIVNAKDYNFWFIKGGNITRVFN